MIQRNVQSGYAPVTREGYIWLSHIRYRATDARRDCGADMCNTFRGEETWKDGWKRALKSGIRIRKVEIYVA